MDRIDCTMIAGIINDCIVPEGTDGNPVSLITIPIFQERARIAAAPLPRPIQPNPVVVLYDLASAGKRAEVEQLLQRERFAPGAALWAFEGAMRNGHTDIAALIIRNAGIIERMSLDDVKRLYNLAKANDRIRAIFDEDGPAKAKLAIANKVMAAREERKDAKPKDPKSGDCTVS